MLFQLYQPTTFSKVDICTLYNVNRKTDILKCELSRAQALAMTENSFVRACHLWCGQFKATRSMSLQHHNVLISYGFACKMLANRILFDTKKSRCICKWYMKNGERKSDPIWIRIESHRPKNRFMLKLI